MSAARPRCGAVEQFSVCAPNALEHLTIRAVVPSVPNNWVSPNG
jgi:hypothetical protein